MVDKNSVVEMRIWAPEFKLPCELDPRFTYVEINDLSLKSDLEEIIKSIDEVLSDWDTRPDLDNLQKRFDVGCSCFLQYFEGNICGWFWTCDFLTYDWIKKEKELPTPNSNYSGGTYVIKKNAPRTAGLQLYAYCISKVMSRTDYGYAYVDDWNKAPIRLNFNCGAKVIDNLI